MNRLQRLIAKQGKNMRDGYWLDDYNQVVSDIAGAITTRIDGANHYFVIEMKDDTDNDNRQLASTRQQADDR